jgi:sulfite reductase (NADPH) flavoprotein alpha-component
MDVLDLSTAYPEILVVTDRQAAAAGLVGEAIVDVLSSFGFDVRLVGMEEAAPEMLLDHYQLILCTGPRPDGALSDTAVEFFTALQHATPDLSQLAYGIVALGRPHHDHYARAGRVFEEVLDELGAVEVIDLYALCQIDDADLDGLRSWSVACAAAFSEAFAPAEHDGALY